MKGTFFQKPLEYKLNIDGESWTQGSQINATLSIANHSSEKIDLSSIGAHLCLATTKKLKAKDDSAFTFIESALMTDKELEANSEVELSFSFNLASDCSITENTLSLYILCGSKESPFDGGMLQLKVVPTPSIISFIEVFENFYKFKFKPLKNKKEYVEAKVTPPDSNDWRSILSMALKMKMTESDLELIYSFKLKKMSYEDSIMGTKDSKLDIKVLLTKKEYSGFGDVVNQDGIMKSINEVLEQVKLKAIL